MNRNLISLALVSFFIQFSIAQSPWTREKGKAYTQLGFTGLFYDKYKFNGKEVSDNNKYSDITIQAYAEYGITNNLEATLILPFKSVSLKNNTSNQSKMLAGIGNVTAGLKYKFYDKKWKISGGINIDINSIKIDLNKELSTGFNANTFIPYLAIGSSKAKWYYFGNIGYGYMDNNYSDFIKATLEVGYEIIPKGHLIFVVDTRNVVRKESAFATEFSQWPSYSDRQTFNALGLKGNYEFKKDKFGANFAVFGATGIDNAPLAPTFNLGLYTKF